MAMAMQPEPHLMEALFQSTGEVEADDALIGSRTQRVMFEEPRSYNVLTQLVHDALKPMARKISRITG